MKKHFIGPTYLHVMSKDSKWAAVVSGYDPRQMTDLRVAIMTIRKARAATIADLRQLHRMKEGPLE